MSARTCGGCGAPIEHLRSDAEACELEACRRKVGRRNRRRRERASLSAEDLAAWRRVLERDGCGHPGAVLTPDQVRAHVLATAEHTP